LIGFPPIDKQVNLSQELRVMFQYFVAAHGFGVVNAATQRHIDCENQVSHHS